MTNEMEGLSIWENFIGTKRAREDPGYAIRINSKGFVISSRYFQTGIE